MGDKQSKEAPPDVTANFFKNDAYFYFILFKLRRYKTSGCVDIEKFKQELVNPGQYCFF